MTYSRPQKALLWPLTGQDEWAVKDGLSREDCGAICRQSVNVYTERGVSGWECSPGILWKKGRYTLPHGKSWMSSVHMLQNNAATTLVQWKMSSCLQLEQKWPHRAALIHFIFCFFLLTTNFTNNYILHIIHLQRRADNSHFILLYLTL